MRALRITASGDPSVLAVETVLRPDPGVGEIESHLRGISSDARDGSVSWETVPPFAALRKA